MKQVLALTVAALLFAQAVVFADTKADIKADDSPATLLFRLVGQKVEIHLKNGEKLAGKLESASGGGVHLSSIAGQEFFDAVIASGDISAVLVRVR